MKKWNLEIFLEAIGYVSENIGGNDDSTEIIRTCFYLSYVIIFSLFVNQKYCVSYLNCVE